MKTPARCTPLIDPLGPDHVAVAQDFAQRGVGGRSTPAASLPLTGPLATVTAMFRAIHARTPENHHHGTNPFDPPVLDQNSRHLDRLTANLAGG